MSSSASNSESSPLDSVLSVGGCSLISGTLIFSIALQIAEKWNTTELSQLSQFPIFHKIGQSVCMGYLEFASAVEKYKTPDSKILNHLRNPIQLCKEI